MARELLDKACTHVKGLYSKKKDMKFDADLLLTLEDGKRDSIWNSQRRKRNKTRR